MPAQEIELAEGVDEHQVFLEKDWSDGLPVVTPTVERLGWMLAGTKRNPDEVVGVIPPAGETATVRDVASRDRYRVQFRTIDVANGTMSSPITGLVSV